MPSARRPDALPAPRAVLFDLDGTLADTAPDLVQALNRLLEQEGKPPLPYHVARNEASHGATALLRRGFGLRPEDPAFAALRNRFLALYEATVHPQTLLFPGIEAVLSALRDRGLKAGIVTNKPAYLTAPVVQALGLAAGLACVVSGDTTAFSKPHPEPLWHAARLLGFAPEACVFVGDAERDIEAGRAAGMRTLVALFGYLRPEDQPESWAADGMIQHPSEILSWLDRWS